MRKVFGIGLSKTGTFSLDAALALLGLRTIHYPPAELMLSRRFQALAAYDAASDIPVSLFFRELDAFFPGSRFILTVRDLDSWLTSIEAHLARRDSPNYTSATPAGTIRARMYGSTRFDRDTYADAYHRHHAAVHSHFRGRPGDLLVMNICEGEGWEPLCEFLDLPAPAELFPHRHKSRPHPIVSVPGPRPSTRPSVPSPRPA